MGDEYPTWSDETPGAGGAADWYGMNNSYAAGYGGSYANPPAMGHPPAIGGNGTFYGEARPRFSEDGRGQPYSTLLQKVGPAAINKDVSYDTSSREPAMLRARVFIGNILKGPVVREDIIELFRPYGTLLACTLLKGYAFIQFSEASEADAACEGLNGKRWKGVMIDVHLAMEGYGKKRKFDVPGGGPASKVGNFEGGGRGGGRGGFAAARGGGSGGRGGYGGGGGGKVMEAAAVIAEKEELIEMNEKNREAAAADNTDAGEMCNNEMADTLICGTCRLVTCDFITFREHRKTKCTKPKDELEPPVLRCASCGLRFLSAWSMLLHLTDFHRMQLFKPDFSKAAHEKAQLEAEKLGALRKLQEAEGKNVTQLDDKRAFELREEEEKKEENGDKAEKPLDNQPKPIAEPPKEAVPSERVTTGADYDEEEEDEEIAAVGTIPTLGY